MFEPVKQHIACPKCGRDIELLLWQEIDTDTENAIEDIASGRLFDIACPCGFASQVQYPLRFDDKLHGVRLWYAPAEASSEAESAIAEAVAAGDRCRLTHSLDSFCEKAAIFGAGLDDRLVEVMKLAARMQLSEALPGAEIDPIVFAVTGGVPRFLFRFDGKTDGIDFNVGEYGEFGTVFAPMLELRGDKDYVIDRRWARQLLGMEQ